MQISNVNFPVNIAFYAVFFLKHKIQRSERETNSKRKEKETQKKKMKAEKNKRGQN